MSSTNSAKARAFALVSLPVGKTAQLRPPELAADAKQALARLQAKQGCGGDDADLQS